MNMPIFLCADNNFVLPAYITLYSLLMNNRGSKKIDIYLLTSGDVEENCISLFKDLEERYDFISVTVMNMLDRFKGVYIKHPWITTATMYRLLIPKIARDLNIGKCIYLDSDIVVEGDISELFDVELKGFCVGAVKETAISCDTDLELRELLEISNLRDYINAGVLLFNIEEIERNGLCEKLEVAGYGKEYPHNDQDAINAIFHHRIKVLPMRFNAINWYLYDGRLVTENEYGKVNILEARRNPLIIHYIGISKPWASRGTILAGKWWKYVRMQDRDVQNQYFQPFIKKSKLSLCVRVKDTIRTMTMKLRIYNVMRNIHHKVWT